MRRRIQLLVVGVIALVLLCAAIPLALLIRSTAVSRTQEDALARANAVARTLRTSTTTEASIKNYLSGLKNTSVTLPDGTVLGEAPPANADAQAFRPSPAAAAPSSASASSAEPSSSAPSSSATATATASASAASPSSAGASRFPFPNDNNQRLPGGGEGGGLGGLGGADGQQATLRAVPSGQLAIAGVQTSAGLYLVRVYLSNSQRYSGVYGWWGILAGVAVALLLVGAGVAELFTRRIVRPLTDTARTADRIGSGDFDARAPVDGPREIAAVGMALNSLADRIDSLIAEERETVADLSHRLRTPLTALRLNVESLQNPSEAERIGEDVSSIERTLTAVIRAARRPQREGRIPSADLTPVVAERVEFWSALAEDQGRTHRVEVPDQSVLVRSSAEDLGAAIDALLENVIAHTPEGSAFAVELRISPDEATLIVSDEGPGIPADAAVRGRSDRGSSGLGLDIARRAAEAAGGSMQINSSAGHGAVVTLRFLRTQPA